MPRDRPESLVVLDRMRGAGINRTTTRGAGAVCHHRRRREESVTRVAPRHPAIPARHLRPAADWRPAAAAGQAVGGGQALRRRTRNFIGVGPRSNASRIFRSRYRRYVGGNVCVANKVNVGGSLAAWVA